MSAISRATPHGIPTTLPSVWSPGRRSRVPGTPRSSLPQRRDAPPAPRWISRSDQDNPEGDGHSDAAVVTEARGLRASDRSRPGDVVALDFFADGRHLVIDAVMTTVYMKTVLEKVATTTGYAAKQAEDMKFVADKTSRQPISRVHGGPHILAPFAIEDGCRLGSHAQALLRSLATTSLAKGRTPPFAKGVADMTHNMQVTLWVRQWQHYRLSAWVHLSISRHAVRLLCPAVAAQRGHL